MTIMTWEQAVEWLKSQLGQKELVRACYYDDPIEAAAERFYRSAEWQAVRRLLPARRGRALEVGAGMGISSYALAKDGWAVSALEPDPSERVGAGAIHRMSAASAVDIKVVQEWGERLPFNDESFDLVYCRAVLHHARNLKDLCREAARVLKPGGVFLATREHVLSQKSDLQIFLNSHPLHKLYGGEHAYLLSEYIEAIEDAGFRIWKTLNPTASDINLHPITEGQLQKRLARKFWIPISGLIPRFALGFVGHFSNVPGRLYSFLATKGE